MRLPLCGRSHGNRKEYVLPCILHTCFFQICSLVAVSREDVDHPEFSLMVGDSEDTTQQTLQHAFDQATAQPQQGSGREEGGEGNGGRKGGGRGGGGGGGGGEEEEEEKEEVMEDMVEVVQFVIQGYHFCRTPCLGSILTVRGRHDVLCFLSSMHGT